MSETLGIDLGTNSIGLTKRNTELGNNIVDQLEYFSSIIFKKGVGIGKSGEFSYAAERTKNRSTRRLYQARKYRIWETLDVLMKYGFCPITEGELNQWRKYDKAKGLKRQYPNGAIKFEQWVRLDFNGNGVADYTSPYQLRAELANMQFDFSKETDKFKFGRALYHIAQRRGFKSSKGETLKEQEKEAEEKDLAPDIEIQIDLKKSEEKKSKDLIAYLEENKLATVGCCFYQLEKEGVRIRASKYQAVRSQYEKEIEYIFTFQNELQVDSDFYRAIHKAIFFKRPLRSQKGLVGKCTLEPTKERCPISHPDFEEFRGWSFINNLKYRKNPSDDWSELIKDQKQQLFDDKFLRTASNFKFEEIRNWLEKKMGIYLSYDAKTINYKDKTNVAGCPISGRLRNLLGDDWRNFTKQTDKTRLNKKTGEVHPISYSMDDIWHVCFSFEDEERIVEFAKNALLFNEKETKSLVNLWVAIPQGYSMLSLKAIRNINKFLKKGLIYTDAVLLAKLPEILGDEEWKEKEKLFLDEISKLTAQNRDEKRILNVANNLIANYKSLELDEQFAYKNTDYRLADSDIKEIEKFSIESYGEKSWEKLPQPEKHNQLSLIAARYQQYFSSSKRDFYRLPKLGDTIKKYLSDNYPVLNCPNSFIDKETKLTCQCRACKKLNLLYHPSQIEFYKPAKEQTIEWKGTNLSLRLLDSPKIGAFKNPMAMRTLHELRKAINHLLKEGIITEDTRIVVETARDLNDANMRWAIEAYQREREKENKEFEAVIRDLYNNTDRTITNDEIDKARILIEQYEIPEKGEIKIVENQQKSKKKQIQKAEKFGKDVTKYRLWLEQGCRCIYTGRIINISDLFAEGRVDFEHTIPRSISFDNSLANLTVCDAHFNRNVKKNQIPSQLSNYDDILLRIQPWKDKVEKLRDNVDFWRSKAKKAQEKTIKDNAIRQRHLWQMELDYWRNKFERFTMQEVTSGFKNSQLVDTRIITKYATHYLKSVFNNVEVQKGSVTADFRKMLGVQSIDEKKSRDKHSHHAIDAAVLTLIPTAAKRDKMLKLFYEIDEKERFENVDQLKYELEKERKNCHLGNVSGISQFIEENILINHITKDQTLTPANRKARRRGKEIFVSDKNGNKITKWITGDCIRGQLHGDTFYGAITKAKKDENGSLVRNIDGKIISDEQVYYVVRRELKFKKNTQDLGFISLADLESKIVDKNLFEIIKQQCEGKSFKDACEIGFYMLDKKGNIVNLIRHIRCYADTKNPIVVKQQTHLSKKSYKQNYYATNGENILYALYRDKDGNTDFECISLFNAAKTMKLEGIRNGIDLFPKQKTKGNKTLDFVFMLKSGIRVILKNGEGSISELREEEIIKRLYIVNRIFDPNDGRIQFQYHLEARDNNGLTRSFPSDGIWKTEMQQGKNSEIQEVQTSFGKRGTNGFSSPDFKNPYPRLLLGKSNLNIWVEGKDFEILYDGKISKL